MKFLDPAVGTAVFALRLLWIPARQIPVDWICVLALFWIVRGLAPENSRTRDLMFAAAGLWLSALYAWSQGPSTWTALCQF